MKALVALQDIHVERDGAPVLNGVTLSLQPGERLAIVGSNGAGKTTLLRTIAGLQKASSGTIEAFGRQRSKEKDFHEVRLRAAYLFQDADDQLFSPTVLEDVAFGPLNSGLTDEEAMQKARETLSHLHLSHLENRLTRKLSGGEKRIVCLAGILALDPEVLLLDEPTNSLDAAHVEKLICILESLDKAMIIVSHDRPVLDRIATRALLLRDGKLEDAILHRHPHLHEHLHIHSDATHGMDG
ncbi:MAG: ABC transporter ATP-binding protein, partial [Hyphomicrobiales bacterium]|nr:ABC transporter ATP-binding protein [Hyphomicrobiales bacterium]